MMSSRDARKSRMFPLGPALASNQSGIPEVWVSKCCTVTLLHEAGSPGRSFTTESSSESFPSSTSIMIAVPVNILVAEAS
jgi:hypothetical protein